MTLHTFLREKPLFYDVIDYERFPKIYARIAHCFKLPLIVHIVGTNGKGTTGRFLAQMLRTQGLHVGHYTSPHIVNFNERIWVDDSDVDDGTLENAHTLLFSWLNEEDAKALSYFEYTTLLAMVVFGQKNCDYVVLEAGLGGEFDATNVFPKVLSIVTPIGFDHQAFLGNTIEAIATTKLNSIHNDFILAPQHEPSVYTLARNHADALGKTMVLVETFLETPVRLALERYVMDKGYAPFVYENLLTAYSALTFLGYDMALEAFDAPLLKGRYQLFLPNVRLDVGHNPMAARALVDAVGEKKVVLVYNSYADKEYKVILEILKPIVKRIEVIDIQSPRAVDPSLLYDVAHALGLPIQQFQGIEDKEEYLVFGSFSVVEAFMKGQRER